MAMRQGLKFPCKAVSLRHMMWAPVVAIHQLVLKSTTSICLSRLSGLSGLFGLSD
ncbi:MAG TPA: hypothetical protein VJ760_06690 [Nitrospiraceae bacterium]|nr:hypothetical protein [Nitrospiraceae bacterium]